MQNILQHLYKKKSLQEIEVEALDESTRQYPYFALGHYLLAKKLAPAGDDHFKTQFQKALVYFHNPLWMQHLLTLEETSAGIAPQDENAQTARIDSEPAGEMPAFSPDFIEEVVLHQEIPVPGKEQLAETPTKVQQPAALENPSITNQPREDAEAAQYPERFSFQAYHTVDYFASQGIRLSQELQANDKLGKQLKSFTEWLKTMRRLPESVAEEVLEKIDDVQVVQFAADSLEEREVVTEAMAEVLVKQEKFVKAQEVYHKLSLLHPQKSAYFAAKIEDLKQR